MKSFSSSLIISSILISLILLTTSSFAFEIKYYYDGDTLIARKDPDGRKYFYHPDHLGSTTLVTDEQGNVIED